MEPSDFPPATTHRPRPEDEYFFREGCHILEHWNAAEDPAASIARARVAPGVRTQTHWLVGTTERYVILSGRGRMFLADDAAGQEVAPGDVVVIPPGVAQSIETVGEEELVFLAICTPRFEPGCYRASAEARTPG